MDMYLDVDGVLLRKNGEAALFSFELIKYLTTAHKVFWLTTHCRGGENYASQRLVPKYPPIAKKYLKKIIPTDWITWKTEAIDFTKDFRWIDDSPYQEELNVLAMYKALNKLIRVDLDRNPEQLKKIALQLL